MKKYQPLLNNHIEQGSSNDDSWDRQLEVNLRQTKYIGKRTGKYYDPDKMVKSDDGFIWFQKPKPNQFTPATKLNMIKKSLGIYTSSEKRNQSDQEEQFSDEKPIKISIRSINKDGGVLEQNKNHRSKMRQSSQWIDKDLDFSYESYQSEKQTYLEESQEVINNADIQIDKEIEIKPEKIKEIKQQINQLKNSEEEHGIKNSLRKKAPVNYKESNVFMKEPMTDFKRKERIEVQKLIKDVRDVRQNDKQKHEQTTQNLEKNHKRQAQIQKKPVLNQRNKAKEAKQQNSHQRRSPIIKKSKTPTKKLDHPWSPSLSLDSMPQGFEQQDEFDRYYEKRLNQLTIQAINQVDSSQILNRTLKGFVSIMQSANLQETNQLDRALINTDTQNQTSDAKDIQIDAPINNGKAFKKNKEKQKNELKRKIKEINARGRKNQQCLRQSRRIKQVKQSGSLLTQSIKKGQKGYHEQQEKINKANQIQEQKKRLAVKKREKNFQDIETSDIVDFQKVEKKKKEVKQAKQTISQKFSVNYEKYDNQDIEIDKQDEQTKQARQAQHNKITSKIVKQVDKNKKKNQRPKRVLPSKNKTQNIKKIPSQQKSRPKSSLQHIGKTKTHQPKIIPFLDQQKDQHSVVESQNLNRKYPQRSRVPRVQFWKNQKVIYDSNRKVINVRLNQQLHQLIGFTETHLSGPLNCQQTRRKRDKLTQIIKLKKGKAFDFLGFDQKFEKLIITIPKKARHNADYEGKLIEVYHNSNLFDLRVPYQIGPNTGHFLIQYSGQNDDDDGHNIKQHDIWVQLTLIINTDQYYP